MAKGRAGGSVLLLAAGTPHVRLAKIFPGFLEYVPQHAARTKEGPIYEAREASYVDDSMIYAMQFFRAGTAVFPHSCGKSTIQRSAPYDGVFLEMNAQRRLDPS